MGLAFALVLAATVVGSLAGAQPSGLAPGRRAAGPEPAERTRVFDPDDLRALPGARDVWSLLEIAEPRVILDRIDNGGLYAGEAGRLSLRGASWTQVSFALDGVDLTDPDRGGEPLVQVPLEGLQTVELLAGAEGPIIRLEPRRPSDTWQAALEAHATPAGLEQDVALTPAPVARLGSWTDLVASAGGPLADRVGLFALARVTHGSRVERGSTNPLDGNVVTALGHLVFARSKAEELRVLAIHQERRTPATDRTRFPDSAAAERESAWSVQGTWERHPSDGAVLSVAGAWQAASSAPPATPAAGVAVDRLLDGPIPGLFTEPRDVGRVDLRLRFEPDLRQFDRGHHSLSVETAFERTGANLRSQGIEPPVAELVGGLPARVWDYGSAGASRWRGTRLTARVTDRWVPTRHLLFDAGFGVDAQRGRAAGGGTLAWSALRASVSAQYRLSDGLALVGGFARAPQRMLLRRLAFGDPAGPQGSVYLWNDRNGDRQLQADERGSLVSRVGPGGSVGAIDPDLHAPRAGQLTAGVDLTFAGWRVTLLGVRRRERSLIESVNTGASASSYRVRFVPDQGTDYVGPEDDRLLPVFDRDPASFGLDHYLLTKPDGHDMLHQGVELTIQTRVGDRLRLAVGGSASRSEGAGCNRGFGVLENDAGCVGELYDDPNADSYSRGRLFFDRAFTGKLAARYASPRDLLVAVAARYQDGQAFARTVVATGLAQGPEPVQAVRRGDHRFTYTLTVDARVEKGKRLGRVRVAGILEIFNALGTLNEVEEDAVSGPAFRRVVAVQPPRAIRVGMRIEH